MKRSPDAAKAATRRRANVAQVKAQFSRFLRQVQQGEEIVVTSRERPVARLVAVEDPSPISSRKPTQDPQRLAEMLDLPALPNKRTNSLKVLLEDRARR